MIDYERVLQAIATKPLNPELFEQFALEALQEQYPGLVPIPGGSDAGRDGIVGGTDEDIPPQLMATKSRTLKGVKDNMRRGLQSLKKNGDSVDRLVLANAADLNLSARRKLIEAANERGARLALEDIHDRNHLAPILRRDGDWRSRLLGLPSDPITLSPVPTGSAGTTRHELPLAGRSAELRSLEGAENDIVLYGVPGCGKSRLASELTGVAFVDKASAGEQLAPDIRWQQPPVIVVDDAGTSEELIQRLSHLRDVEPDLTYRIIAICWPDEKDAVGSWLGPQAERLELDLIERQVLDEIIVQMGITNERARTEILNQAEGRVGWAVALANLLLQTRDATSLLSGRALYGHVVRYLRRAKLGDRVQDILAVTAMLNGLTQGEVHRAAELLGVPRSDFNDNLRLAAQGGLIDVVNYLGERYYYTRPPTLATVLVAERLFNEDVPSVSVNELMETWPERYSQICMQTIGAAMLGATEARRLIDSLFSEIVVNDSLPMEFLSTYAMLDDNAAARVMGALATIPRPLNSHMRAAICQTYVTIAYRFKRQDALTSLLNLAVDDTTPTNYSTHPSRLIEANVQAFSVESGHRFESRKWTIETASAWLPRNSTEGAQRVYAAIAKACLSPKIAGQSIHPGNPQTLQIRKGMLSAAWMERIEAELWPLALEMMDIGGRELISALLDVVDEWLNVSDGVQSSDLRIGTEVQEQAKATGSKMIRDLVTGVAMSTGLAVRTQGIAQRHAIPVPMPNTHGREVLFFDLDAKSRMTVENISTFVTAVRAWGAEQSNRAPNDVVDELVELRDELRIAGLTWPDRIVAALEGIAESVDNPREWLDAASRGGLDAEAATFVPWVFKHGDLTRAQCADLTENLYTRCATITTVLSAADADPELVDEVIEALDKSDYQCLFVMLLREEDAPGIAERLLSHPRVEVHAVVAYAYWGVSRHLKRDNIFPQAWFEAIEKFRPDMVGRSEEHAVPDLLIYMDSACPANLFKLLVGMLTDVAIGENFVTARDSCWRKLHKLRPAMKSALWEFFKDSTRPRHILEWNLAGDDETWLSAELENDKLSPGEILNFASGLEQAPSLETLARLLIPRGVAPKAIASRVDLGDSFGERSIHYQSLVDKFAELSRSDDIRLRQLGEVGVEMYSQRRDIEAEKEHLQRIRGEL